MALSYSPLQGTVFSIAKHEFGHKVTLLPFFCAAAVLQPPG